METEKIRITKIESNENVVNPVNTNIVYVTLWTNPGSWFWNGGVCKSSNGGRTLERINKGFGDEENLKITSIRINPADSNILSAATSDEPFHDQSSGRGIFISTNAGVSWKPVNKGLEVLYFNSLAIDPSDPSIIFAGSSGNGIYKGVF